MIFKTERLELVPLALDQMKLWRHDSIGFEKELNCIYKGEPLEEFFLEYLNEQIRIISENKDNYLYYTFWLLIRKSDRVAIGSAAFKGSANHEGEIEIGYGLGKGFEHNGYMTEAVGEMCKWGLAQENVNYIIAETDLDGYASQRVLERNGFIRYKFSDSSWWRLGV